MSETAEEREAIVSYLSTSFTVWRNVSPTTDPLGGTRTYDTNWPLVTSTFFYGVRGNTATRLYMWGALGNFTSYKRQPMYTGAATSLDFNFQLLAAASTAARAEVFPTAAPAGVEALYAPNTEEFLSRGAVHNPLQDVAHLSAADALTVIVCDSSGRLYVRGDAYIELFPRTENPLGLGPHRAVPLSGPTYGENMASPTKQYALQRVYGDDASFSETRFVQVHAAANRTVALDDQGYMWFAGDATTVTSSDEFPGYPESSRKFEYFRKHAVTTWLDIHGATQTGELLFKSVSDSNIGASRLLAVTQDGRLFVAGQNVRGNGSAFNATRYTQIGGFIDTIVPKSGDDGAVPVINLTTTGVSISIASPAAGGTRATATPIMRNIGVNQWVLFGVRLDNPGSGYTTPPAVTFRYGTTNRTDLVSCTVFSGAWELAEVRGDHYAAISSEGVLYLWGGSAYNNAISNAAYGTVTNTLNTNFRLFNAPIRAVQFQQFGQPVPQQPGAYTKVKIRESAFGGVAIADDGQLSYWGFANRTPNGTLARDLTTLPGSEYIDCDISGADCFAVIDSNNDLYTYGLMSSALARGSDFSASLGIANYQSIGKIVGSAKWSRVFAVQGGRRGFYAVRLPEQLDEFGVRKNPLPPFGS